MPGVRSSNLPGCAHAPRRALGSLLSHRDSVGVQPVRMAIHRCCPWPLQPGSTHLRGPASDSAVDPDHSSGTRCVRCCLTARRS